MLWFAVRPNVVVDLVPARAKVNMGASCHSMSAAKVTPFAKEAK